jgi:hypothetical protein
MAASDLTLDTISCPKCGEVIPVSEALSHQVVEKARAEIRAEAVEQRKAFAKRDRELVAREEALTRTVEERVLATRAELSLQAENAAKAAVSSELEDLRRQAEEKSQQLQAAQQTELALRQEKRALEEREQALELEVSRRLDEELRRVIGETTTRLEEEHRQKQRRLEEALRAKEAREQHLRAKEEALEQTLKDRIEAARQELASKAEQTARSALATEMEDLRRQAREKDNLLMAAQATELDLRQQKRALEEREKTLTLEVARSLEEEVSKVEEATAKRLEEEHRLRDAEKDRKLQEAQRINDELRRKLQQGSQQTQGEVLELELETLLRNAFPSDHVEPVPKGIRGADVVQKVLLASGHHHCGTIVWEAKRTKTWSDGWVQKLKDDQRSLKAELAVIVSEALPKDCQHFNHVQGVWVTNPQCALALATALRFQLKEVATSKLAAVGKNEKMEVLYAYLSGAEFRQRVETIVESFNEMQKDLQEERRAAERRWAKREKLLQKVIGSTSGMYGDLQGLIGSSMQTIPALSDGNDVDRSDDAVTIADQRMADPQDHVESNESEARDDNNSIENEQNDGIFSLRDFNRSRPQVLEA